MNIFVNLVQCYTGKQKIKKKREERKVAERKREGGQLDSKQKYMNI